MSGRYPPAVFEPLELLEKLVALIPRQRINLVLYHGRVPPPVSALNANQPAAIRA